jgi:diguanylate cyclase
MLDSPLPSFPFPEPGEAEEAQGERRAREVAFVDRVHRMRTFGLALGFLCVGSAMLYRDPPALVWVVGALYAFAWPHLAWPLALHSRSPKATEYASLTFDSAAGGVWIAAMHFNLLPSVLLFTMLVADKVAVGGIRFAAITTAALVVACAVTSAALQFPVDLHTPMPVVAACVPLLVGYPLALSHAMHTLARLVTRQNRRLERINTTDELTGVLSRRQGRRVAAMELERHRRTGQPAVLLVVDIDRFKDVNDRYGHPAGDEVLCAVAGILRDAVRAVDAVSRLAGDEFLLILPGTDLAGAADVAARVRERLARTRFDHAADARCTICLGAAQAAAQMADAEDWLQQADAALYRAKNAGRDRLVCAPLPVDGERPGAPAPAAPAAPVAVPS